MGEIIKFNQKRKEMARAEKEKKASENRVKFGRTKGEKKLEKAKVDKAERHLDGHKRDTEEE